MSDIGKKLYDAVSIERDINERKQIINEYLITKHLDRDKAIRKIMELRSSNIDVLTVSIAHRSSIPLCSAPDDMLLNDLQMQIDMLEAELIKKA